MKTIEIKLSDKFTRAGQVISMKDSLKYISPIKWAEKTAKGSEKVVIKSTKK